MLHTSEWLAQAKKVPVGQKRRVQHCAEPTKAMDVYNNDDSWACYCHRCHEGGSVRKQYVEDVVDVAPQFRKYLNIRSCISLDALYKLDSYKYSRLVLLLHDKGMSTTTIAPLNPMYNTEDDRLVFKFKGVHIGRDTTGLSSMKWFKYHVDDVSGYAYLQGKNEFCNLEPVIITEDLFSAQKIRYYTGCSVMPLFGTSLKDDALVLLSDKLPVLCLDGDLGGWKATTEITKKLNLYSIDYKVLKVPDGLDPKDLKPNELIELVRGI